MAEFEKLTERLKAHCSGIHQSSPLFVVDTVGSSTLTIPVPAKICSIISSNLTPTKPRGKGYQGIPENFSNTNTSILKMADQKALESRDQEEPQSMDFKDMFAEHDNQVVLSNQMILFRQEYMDMRSEVENQLSRLQLDCSAMTREASCSFALLLSQMGCPSCSSGAGMEACYHQVKILEGELERLHTENKTLSGKVVSMEQSQSDLKDQLTDSENVTKSLTETLDQLQSHCNQLEENSTDTNGQWEELIAGLEKDFRSIGRSIIADSETYSGESGIVIEIEEPNSDKNDLALLAESTVVAVNAALIRRKTEVDRLKNTMQKLEQQLIESAAIGTEMENNERTNKKKIEELEAKLGDLMEESNQQDEAVKKMDRLINVMKMEMAEKENVARQLQDELEREKSTRQRMEETLEELRQEESLQRSSHSELVTDYQQLTCDNQFCRTSMATFEERLHRLRKEMEIMREEKTRLNVALDFSKDERNLVNKQLKEAQDKSKKFKDQLRNVQLEKMSVEDSLGRLHLLKSQDEEQIKKMSGQIDQAKKDEMNLTREKEEFEEDILILKRELVKAEELRMRLENFTTSLERSLSASTTENEEMKEQIENLMEINDQAADKQNIMDRRFMEIETSNNHLTEELARLTVEFELAKERERTCNEEIERARAKISTVEEENRSLETQIRNLQNANQLTQVSIVASQTNYDGLEMELERVTQELQGIVSEKEDILVELHEMHQRTSAALSQLQNENKQHVIVINELQKSLEKAEQEQAALAASYEKEKQNMEMIHQQETSELEKEHRHLVATSGFRQENDLKEIQNEALLKISRLEEDIKRKEADMKYSLSILELERNNVQEKLDLCNADLESERATLERLRREETERMMENSSAAGGLRVEINRLENELRQAQETQVKDRQSSEQILTITKDSLKRSEQDLGLTRTELTAAKRELKDAFRQLEGIQLHLGKAESQRDEAKKEGLLGHNKLEDAENERDGFRNSVVALQSSVRRMESDRGDLMKCLEEARKRIGVLEENRSSMEQDMSRVRSEVKEAEQLVSRLREELNGNQQKLARSQDVQNRWKERSEALVEQLQAEQNRAILAEQASAKCLHKSQTLKLQYQQLEQQCSAKLQQTDSQHSISQQRLNEMDLVIQKAIARSKRLEDERHSFHSRLLDTDKEVNVLKQRLSDADAQSRSLTDQLHRVDSEKKELTNRLSVFYASLRKVVRLLEDGNKSGDQSTSSSRFMQPFTTAMDGDASVHRENSDVTDVNAVQSVLQELMRHIILLQSSSRRGADIPTRDESSMSRNRSTHEERQQQISRQLRSSEGSVAGIRQKLNESLNAVAQYVSPAALSRESKKLDGLFENSGDHVTK